jgi:hypothetical protein
MRRRPARDRLDRQSQKVHMDCTICGKATLPGAMLCVPCKAALKRARYVTVQESIRRPSIIDVRRKPRRARPADPTPEPARRARAADSIPRPETPPRARVSPDVIKTFHAGSRVFVALLFVAVLGGAVYFGQRELSANAWSGASVAAEAARPAMAESVATIQTPAVEPAPAPVPPPAATIAVEPEKRPEIKPATGKRTMLATRATFATADGDPPDAVAPPPEPEKPVPVAVPPPRPVPDRWQNMRDAQAECDRLGIFDGLICGQRVRIQYCEGYWGKVAQCQGANAGYER